MNKFLRNKLLWAVVAIAIIAVGWWKLYPKESQGNIDKSGIVMRGDITQRISFSGMITPNRTTQIAAPYDGYVRKLFVRVGDIVKTGDPIVSVSQTPSNTAEELFPIRSPFAGSVVQILKTEGEFVAKAPYSGGDNTIVRIDDLSKVFVQADVPEIDYPKLKINQKVDIKAGAIPDKIYHGQIQSIARASKHQEHWDRSRVEFPIIVAVLDSDENLKSGMSVIVDVITSDAKNVLLLPHEYIQKDKNNYFVIRESGQRQSIEVGLQNEEAFEIKNGVAEGDVVKQTDFLKM